MTYIRTFFVLLLNLFIFTNTAQALIVTRVGAASDIKTPTRPLICLAGGGDDNLWIDGWRHMISRSGGGDIVVIQADSERNSYEGWLLDSMAQRKLPPANSVTILAIESSADANLPQVERIIENAELIFFDGGDQSLYISRFRNSKFLRAVENAIYRRKIPVGGTSAGMALLAGIDFTAEYPSPSVRGGMVRSEDVLNDPTGKFVSFDRSVLIAPYLGRVITDTHFSERNRQGRLFGFMARASNYGYNDVNFATVKAIASDEPTAVCYNERGQARVFGQGRAFFLKSLAPVERLEAGKPLHWSANGKAVEVYVIDGRTRGAWFDVRNWQGGGGVVEYWSVDSSGGKSPQLKVYRPNPSVLPPQ